MKKIIKIFGIGASILLVLFAFSPIISANKIQETSTIDQLGIVEILSKTPESISALLSDGSTLTVTLLGDDISKINDQDIGEQNIVAFTMEDYEPGTLWWGIWAIAVVVLGILVVGVLYFMWEIS